MIQGKKLSQKETDNIRLRLEKTDSSMGNIAKRVGVSHYAVFDINKRYRIRHYGGHHNIWTVGGDPEQHHVF